MEREPRDTEGFAALESRAAEQLEAIMSLCSAGWSGSRPRASQALSALLDDPSVLAADEAECARRLGIDSLASGPERFLAFLYLGVIFFSILVFMGERKREKEIEREREIRGNVAVDGVLVLIVFFLFIVFLNFFWRFLFVFFCLEKTLRALFFFFKKFLYP